MGSQFFWFLDIVTVAVFAVYLYRGARKGAVGVMISAVAAIAAFLTAYALSGAASEKIYDALIRDRIESTVESNMNSVTGGGIIDGLAESDMSKALIKGTPLSELELEFDETGKADIDLSSADLTGTGIQNADLSMFGITEDFDFSDVKTGRVTVTREDIEKYGIDNVVLAKIIAANITSEQIDKAFSEIGSKLSGTFAKGFTDFGKQLASGSGDAAYSVVVSVITAAGEDYGARLIDTIITPAILPPLKIIVFLIIFALVTAILNLIANVSKLVNRLPVAGQANSLLGAVLGLVEGLIVLILFCMVMKFLIWVCGGSLVFINEPTIQRTWIFRYIYAIDPLNILRGGI